MKEQPNREEYEQRLAALRAERDMFKRLARRNLELAMRLSDLHVRQAARELRRGK